MKIVAMTYQSTIGLDSDMSASVNFTNSHAERKSSFVSFKENDFTFENTNILKKDLNHD